MLFLTGEKVACFEAVSAVNQDEMIPPAHSRMLHGRAEKSRLRRQVVRGLSFEGP